MELINNYLHLLAWSNILTFLIFGFFADYFKKYKLGYFEYFFMMFFFYCVLILIFT